MAGKAKGSKAKENRTGQKGKRGDGEGQVKRGKRGGDTRKKILEVATRLFARRGFAGTSMDEIADEVGIKKASLYHHFASKHEIYDELIRHVLSEVMRMFRTSFSSGDIIKDAENFMKQITFFIAQNDDYLKILVREVLDENVPVRQLAKKYLPNLLSVGAEMLEEGKKKGIFRKDVDPIQLSVTITGAVLIYFLLEPLIQPFLKKEVRSPSAISERVKHISDVLLYGIVEDKVRNPAVGKKKKRK